MRKKLFMLALSATLNTAIAAENAPDTQMIQSVIDNVIIQDIDAAKTAIKTLKTAIKDNTQAQRKTAVDKAFADVVATWKAVQATYIIGEVDSEMIDTPRLIDTFHEGNEKLAEQIERAVNSGSEPRVALFKNTFKSINALGMLLYNDKTLSPTERTYADFILNTMTQHLSDIKQAYSAQTTTLTNNQDQSMSYVLNALIDSSYKLKEWRVGEAAGLTKKYEGKPDNRRQEYARSGNSLTAVAAILAAHDDMMGKRDYENLGSTASKQGAENEVTAIRKLISDAKQQVNTLQTERVTDFTDPRIKPLYETLGQLNDAYYQSLVQALPVQAKILDADGD